MSDEFEDFGALRRNSEECERAGATLRQALGGGADDRMPPIMQIFENARNVVPEASSLDIVVRSDTGMDVAAAFAVPEKQEIHVGLSFVENALLDKPDARFVGFHELMHVVFHRGAPRYFRMAAGNVVYPFLHDKHERAEWQADRIARATFMPPKMVAACANAFELAQKAGMPVQQAIERIKELKEAAPRSTPNDVAIKIATFTRDSSKGTPAFNRLEAEALKLQLWTALPTIEGEDTKLSRQCGKFRVLWADFGKTTGCGWFIESGKIVSFFGSRS